MFHVVSYRAAVIFLHSVTRTNTRIVIVFVAFRFFLSSTWLEILGPHVALSSFLLMVPWFKEMKYPRG